MTLTLGAPHHVATTVQILLALTVLAAAPAILLMMTSYLRIAVVLAFLQQALAVGTALPNAVLSGLALFLTGIVMAPVLHAVYTTAYLPMAAGKMGLQAAMAAAQVPMRAWMEAQVNPKDLLLFEHLRHMVPTAPKAVPFFVLVPSFVVSELTEAFRIAVMIYIPFVVVDLAVQSILLSAGMLMLPPTLVSTPIKILLFLVSGGWPLLVGSLVRGFRP